MPRLSIIPTEDVYVAGEHIINGLWDRCRRFSGFTLTNNQFHGVPGTLSQENGRVYWTPMTMGNHLITMDDSGFISTTTVSVGHGLAIDTRVVMT